MGAMANNSKAAYAGWEEVLVSTPKEKWRREVHYYLIRSGGGGRDLVVVGKEKSATRMSYRYMIKDNKLLLSILNGAPRLKLRSRREVVDWINSILSGEQQPNSSKHFGGGLERNLDDDVIEDVMRQKIGQYNTEFSWLGSSWTCRKRRTHYQSFCRNGAVISVQQFVYVLAEEGKRLVAYLDDMYEDTRGSKMVVVRWFHKIDEVGFVLPHNYNDREIFFSLCLQDLNVECIDGLATVLSPEHFEKFTSGTRHVGLMPFMCCKLFDNDDVKPFDITRVKGYWKQELLRNISALLGEGLKSNRSVGEAVGSRPNKRIRRSKESEIYFNSPEKEQHVEASLLDCSGCKEGVRQEKCSYESFSDQDKSEQYLAVGSQIEVLSQDSGIRGCWFSASIIKKHKDKVKVQYRDVKDAVDDSKNLEEWILASRIAAPDVLGLRLSGRTIVRPIPSGSDALSGAVSVGTVVDAWWHDGWWEGIVVKKESGDSVKVYFPEEKKEHIFNAARDLRHSKEWLDNGWQNIKPRTDIVSAIYGVHKISDIDGVHNISDIDKENDLPSGNRPIASRLYNEALPKKVFKTGKPQLSDADKLPLKSHGIRDLTKDYLLTQLRWRSSGKRRSSRSPVHKSQCGTTINTSSVESGMLTFDEFFVNGSLKLDPDNCKSARDSRFRSSVVPPMTNLVMSR